MLRVRFSLLFAVLSLIGLTFTQCSKEESLDPNSSTSKLRRRTIQSDALVPLAPGAQLDAPSLSLTTKGMASLVIKICAGPSGAPAGFSLQWMKRSDFIANGSQWDDNTPSFCALSISGNANSSRYMVGADGCVDVHVGEILMDNGAGPSCNAPLECGTAYVFRAFAHAVPGQGGSKSDWSATFTASTWECEIKPNMMCTRTMGEWRDNPLSWPVSSLVLGTRTYTKAELLSILNTDPAGNGLIGLAHQAIAAKLNVAAGSPSSYVWHPLQVVDQMIGAKVIPPVGGGTMTWAEVDARMYYLWSYNDGAIGPGHCFEQ